MLSPQRQLEDHLTKNINLSGATTHDVRYHFLEWAPRALEARLKPGVSTDALSMIDTTDTARYKFCLMVDEICLESLDHDQENMNWPVVKVINCDWGPLSLEERQYEIHPDYHDGETDDWEEEVGWMYLPVHQYVEWYDLLSESWQDWWEFYVRPPYIDRTETSDELVGSWRKK